MATPIAVTNPKPSRFGLIMDPSALKAVPLQKFDMFRDQTFFVKAVTIPKMIIPRRAIIFTEVKNVCTRFPFFIPCELI